MICLIKVRDCRKMKDNIGNLDSITEDMSKEQWQLILWSLLTDLPVQEWNEFVHDLVYKNRFSSSHKVIGVINGFSRRCTSTIKKGQVLYRARIYHQDPFHEFLSDVFINSAEVTESPDLRTISEYYHMQLAALIVAVEEKTPKGKEIIDAYKRWQRKKFKGYNSSDSGAPPADNVPSGRFNPEKIRYLYLAEDPKTAIYEVRPTIGQHVSVASFKMEEEIRIYDLAREVTPKKAVSIDKDYSLFDVICQRFSEPNTGDAFKYLPTQYLGEIIKQMGFDGLRFKSSLKNGGINVVLFDDKKCRAVKSDIIKVGDIKLELVNPDIYELEKFIESSKS